MEGKQFIDSSIEVLDTVKRFIVVIVTQLFLFTLGCFLLYMLYTKNCNIADIIALMTMIIFGIGAIGGGYIGVKTWESFKNGTEKQEEKTQ